MERPDALPIVFRPVAKLELDESISWYENKRQGLGRQFRVVIEKHLEKIATQPQRFRQLHGQIRRVALGRFPYLIYFLLEVDRIVVLAVFHTRRAPRNLEGRLTED